MASAVDTILENLLEARRKQIKAQPTSPQLPSATPPAPAAPEMTPDEMSSFIQQSMEYGHWFRMQQLAEEHNIHISGKVERGSHHYVHQRSTTFTLYVEYYGDEPAGEIATWIGETADAIEKEIGEKVVDINHKIYRALEREYEYRLSDEAVDEDIAANQEGATYDEEGEEGGGDLTWDQLDDSAKNKIREERREMIYQDPDTYWSEHIIEEWITELAKMGFGYGQTEKWSNRKRVQEADPAISWSGFSSQGDGASFTTSHFDFNKWVEYWTTGQDKVPGPMADRVNESEEDLAGIADDEIDRMVRNAAFTDYSQVLGGEDRHSEGRTTHYQVILQSHTDVSHGVYGYFHAWVTPYKEVETVLLELRLQARGTEDSEPEDKKVNIHALNTNGAIERKAKFWVPATAKGDFLARLSDFVDYLKGVIQRRTPDGNLPVHPQKFVNQIAFKLSKFSGLWKREHEAERRAAYKKTVDQIVIPEAAEEDDVLRHVSNSALATAFPFQSFMTDISQGFWNGMKQFSWKRENEWFRISATVVIADLELKEPWSFDVRVKDHESTQTWTMHFSIYALEEKALLGPTVKDLLNQFEEILNTTGYSRNRPTKSRQKEFLDHIAGTCNQIFRTAGYFEEL